MFSEEMAVELHSFKSEKHSWLVMTRLQILLRRERLTDCTLFVEGEIIHVHKVVLGAVSPYFEALFTENPHENSYDLVNFKYKDVRAVIDFLYYGFVKLPPEDMKTFQEVAEKFQIRLSCASPSESCGEDSEILPPPMGVAERSDPVEDSNLFTGGSVKEIPPENVMSVLSSESISQLSGCVVSNESSLRRFPSPPRNISFNSQEENRHVGRKKQIEPTVKSTTQKKSVKFSRTSLPPAANMTSDSSRDTPARRRKSKNTQLIDDTSNSTNNPPTKRGRISRSSVLKDPPNSSEGLVENNDPERKGEQAAGKDTRGEEKVWIREVKNRRCKHCSKTLATFKSYCFHLRTHNLLPCLVCERPFGSQSALDKHSANCLYRCEICGVQMKRKYSMTEHMRLHSGDKPYTCEECGKQFSKYSGLHSHVRVHVAEKPFCCEICGKNFRHSFSLKQHLRIHSDTRPFVCKYCGKDFKLSTTLKNHEYSHTGEKQFDCDVCKASFRVKNSLRRHMSLHLIEKSYNCKVCDKKFPQLVLFKRHVCFDTGDKPSEKTRIPPRRCKRHEKTQKN